MQHAGACTPITLMEYLITYFDSTNSAQLADINFFLQVHVAVVDRILLMLHQNKHSLFCYVPT